MLNSNQNTIIIVLIVIIVVFYLFGGMRENFATKPPDKIWTGVDAWRSDFKNNLYNYQVKTNPSGLNAPYKTMSTSSLALCGKDCKSDNKCDLFNYEATNKAPGPGTCTFYKKKGPITNYDQVEKVPVPPTGSKNRVYIKTKSIDPVPIVTLARGQTFPPTTPPPNPSLDIYNQAKLDYQNNKLKWHVGSNPRKSDGSEDYGPFGDYCNNGGIAAGKCTTDPTLDYCKTNTDTGQVFSIGGCAAYNSIDYCIGAPASNIILESGACNP